MRRLRFLVTSPEGEQTEVEVAAEDPRDCVSDVHKAIRAIGLDPATVTACVRVSR